MRKSVFLIAPAILAFSPSCSRSVKPGEEWRARNDQVIRQQKIAMRERKIPETAVRLKLHAGQPTAAAALDEIQLGSGVKAKIAWGRGALVEFVSMEAGSVYPEQSLSEELITVVQGGSAIATLDGKKLELGKDAVVYLIPGVRRSLKAGPDGWKAIEVYSPVRLDHLDFAGAGMAAGARVSFPDQGIDPSLESGKVYNLNEIQLTPLTDPEPSKSYRRSASNSRLIWGKNVLLSLLTMDPNSEFPLHNHPEEQMMFTLRGALQQTIIDKPHTLRGETGDALLMPGGMVHGARLSEFGADALDVFWPVRPDYLERARRQSALYEQVVPPGATVKKVAGGLRFGEGPTWLRGRLYLSDMFFRDPVHGDWTGSPERSRLLVMEPEGKWRVLSRGRQTNGTIAAGNGNLLVCDMFGHRLVEMAPDSGKIVRTVLDSVNGAPIDGPNDLVMDARGGIYVSDPQVTAEARKNQPGKQVYYVSPEGKARVVIPAGDFAMPNGVEISPDGKTFFVANTWLQPGGNFIWAYDVQADGSLANRRRFAMLNLAPEVLSAPDPANRYDSRADGMAVDTAGRLYVSTLTGVQIFDKSGAYAGTIWCPENPISCTFGGSDDSTLYMVGRTSVWSIVTKAKGFRLPEGLN